MEASYPLFQVKEKMFRLQYLNKNTEVYYKEKENKFVILGSINTWINSKFRSTIIS